MTTRTIVLEKKELTCEHRLAACKMIAAADDPVLNEISTASSPAEDSHCLATLKHYRSLVPMGQEARKPIFALTPADGAIGNHAEAVVDARNDFKELADKLMERMNIAQATEGNQLLQPVLDRAGH